MMFLNLIAIQLSQFGSGLRPPTDSNYTPEEIVTSGSGDTALNAMTKIISNVVALATTLAGIFFIIYFLLAAYAWITSEGDSGKLKKARDQIIHAIIGLALVVATYAMVGFIGKLVGIDILNPARVLKSIAP